MYGIVELDDIGGDEVGCLRRDGGVEGKENNLLLLVGEGKGERMTRKGRTLCGRRRGTWLYGENGGEIGRGVRGTAATGGEGRDAGGGGAG